MIGPFERLGHGCVEVVDESEKLVTEFALGVEVSTFNHLFGQDAKPTLDLVHPRGMLGRVYSSNTNISFFHSADEFETIRQQGTQFALIFARISEEFLTSGFEFGKRFEVLVVQGFLLEEFPEAFDQIQIRRIGREEYELDA